jgi:AraC family transcriptional regulator of adaptative response/methylated-DNA-[protein]-cysteine methyltransferase
MMFTFDDDALYDALLRRDPDLDGRAYVAVATTRVFCRLTCPARKPLRRNCRFFETAAQCMEAGYRPCRRCRPLRPSAEDDPVIAPLLEALEREPDRVWREADVIGMGFDPSTARRAFRRHFGTTFLELARLRRIGEGLTAIAQSRPVIEAQLDAGFESASGFRSAFCRLLGVPPGRLAGADALLTAHWLKTPLGEMVAVADDHGLHLLEFTDRRALGAELKALWKRARGKLGLGRRPVIDQAERELADYFSGRRAEFQTPLHFHGSEFTRSVWAQLRRIPAGQVRSYGQIADAIGRPGSARAVARANGANPIALMVPCHRVIGADGSLTGYGGGLWRKQKLIELEREYLS